MPGIFISYRRGPTSQHAGRLYDRLAKEFGDDRVFMDTIRLRPGDDFEHEIEQEVGQADALIVIIGPDWADARDESGGRRLDDSEDFVRREVQGGLDKDILVVPLLVAGARMPEGEALPDSIRALGRRQWLELRDAHWPDDVGALIGDLRKRVATGSAQRFGGMRRRFLALAGLAVVGLAAATTIALTGDDAERASRKTRLAATSKVPVGGVPVAAAKVGDRVWVVFEREGRLKSVRRGATTATDSPSVGTDLSALATAGGRLFVSDYGNRVSDNEGPLVELDPHTGGLRDRLASIPGEPYEIATDGRTVWETDLDVVTAVDLKTGEAKRARAGGGGWFTDVAVRDGKAWVVKTTSGQLFLHDSRTGRPRGRPIDVGARPMSVAVTDSAVWIASEQGRLTRLRPDGSDPTYVVVGGEGRRVVEADSEGVWVVDEHGEVILVDPRAVKVVARTRVRGDATDVVPDGDGAWVLSRTSKTPSSVVRIERETSN